MSCDTTSIYIDPLAVLGGIIDITTLAGSATGSTLVVDGTGNDLVIKDLIAGGGIIFAIGAGDITISAAAGAGTLQTAYDNTPAATPEIIITAADGPVTIQDAAVATGGNFFEVNDSGAVTTVFEVDAAGATVDGKLTVTGLIDPTGIVLDEQASVPGGAPGAGKATLWVKDDAPNVLKFTDDTGTELDVVPTVSSTSSAEWSGPWAANQTGKTYEARKTGKMVQVFIELVAAVGNSTSAPMTLVSPLLPAAFRPTTSQRGTAIVYGNSYINGMFRVNSSGVIAFFQEGQNDLNTTLDTDTWGTNTGQVITYYVD